ncbi:ABC transporter substrate-binding protein [Plastorhodobacter daqingensis]|uniref:ABC transporter substrate-binding protein n=1 Tax=Plastorhodobacter daqingensis TaxID=1387281 RepID=A0ABW2UL91_9RHOB
MKLWSAFLSLFLLFPSMALSQDRLSLMLDWFVNPDHGPIILARELGYFEAEGLVIDLITPSDPNDPPRMVAAGRIDLAVTYQPQLHLSRHQDLPLLRVGTLISTPLTCLVVLADGPVKSLGDLRGRKVGYAVAGVQEALLGGMLASHGLRMEDVEAINIGWSISPALMSGQVDAVIGAYRNFELNQLALEGVEGRCFYPEEEGVPAYDELIYVAHSERLDHERIARFLAATERATHYIVNHPQAAWEIFAATAPELRTELNARAWVDTWPRFDTRPAAMDPGRYQRFEGFLQGQGLVTDLLSVAELAVDVNAP